MTTSLSTLVPHLNGCNGLTTTFHMRRRATAAALTDDFSGFLPAIRFYGSLAGATGVDTTVSDSRGCVYALTAGSRALPPVCSSAPNQGGSAVVVASPQLPYSLARQYPTLLSDPFALLAQVLPVGDVDLWYSFLTFYCAA